MSKVISLSRGKTALVGDSDYEWLNSYKWSCATRGYAQRAPRGDERTVTTSAIKMHRQILALTDPAIFVDHIDGNPLNNTRMNLRIASNAENSRNTRKRSSKYSSFKGVTKVHGKYWVAQLMYNYKNIPLGYFNSEHDAAVAYNNAALQYFGEFANLNKVDV